MVVVMLLTTSGVTYHYHFCGGTLMKFSVLHTPKACCEHPENCCKDKAEHFQLQNDYLFTAVCVDSEVSCVELPLWGWRVETDNDLSPQVQSTEFLPVKPEESPPPLLDLRLALLQQYLI